MHLDRRTLIRTAVAGLGVAAVNPYELLAATPATSPPSLFAGTPLAGNRLAANFKRFDMALPDIMVSTAQGPRSLAGVGGKTRILSLWAEWCVPCIVEVRDFAKVRPQFANDRFDIGLLMTATKFDRGQALERLRQWNAQSLPLLVETGFQAAERLAVPPNAKMSSKGKPGFSFPCTLLVDAKGRIRARAFGAPVDMKPTGGKKGVALTEAQKAELMTNGTTIWAGPAGAEFLRALSTGLLDRI